MNPINNRKLKKYIITLLSTIKKSKNQICTS